MRLAELEGRFVGGYAQIASRVSHRELASVDGAQGVLFECPKCHGHQVLCWFKNPRNAPIVPADAKPGPGRWIFTGDSIDTLTLEPSVDLSKIDAEHPAHEGRCYWHGWVKSGNAQ